MDIKFEKMSVEHQKPVMKIFNYYIASGTAAFPENELPEQFYGMLMKKSEKLSAYVLLDTVNNIVVGFCSLNPFSPFSTFKSTATTTYFIDKGYVGKGLGKQCLDKLEGDAVGFGIRNIVAEISSENIESLRFHERNGFFKVGELMGVGEKLGRGFGVIYMEKMIER